MLTLRTLLLTGLFALCTVEAVPQNRNGNGNRNGQNGGGQRQRLTAQEQADQIPQGLSVATDGSTILDTTTRINGQNVRFRVSAPADQFTTITGIPGASQAAAAAAASVASSASSGKAAAATSSTTNTTTGNQQQQQQQQLGVNILLHGDGGQSFFDFPNQGVLNGIAGVALLAPNENLFWGGGAGLERTDGEAHASIVDEFVRSVLPQVLAFDAGSVSFTGVSGGSLLLSGFFMPAFMQNFAGPVDDAGDDGDIGGNATAGAGAGAGAGASTRARARARGRQGRNRLASSTRQTNNTNTDTSGTQNQGLVLLNCGALPPQVPITASAAAALANTRIHFQSTQAELAELQDAIPAAVAAYEQVATAAGLTTAEEVGALQTVDNSPNGGHCEFDEQDFVSGVQLMADSFSAIMQAGGDGLLAGTDVNVLNPVPGNEKLVFSGAS